MSLPFVSPAAKLVLLALQERGTPCNAIDLAGVTGLRGTTVLPILRRLAHKEWIRRVEVARHAWYTLTPEGTQVLGTLDGVSSWRQTG